MKLNGATIITNKKCYLCRERYYAAYGKYKKKHILYKWDDKLLCLYCARKEGLV